MTNFDFLSCDEAFAPFAETAAAAEKIFSINTASCALTCRAAMEDAVKWMYSVDRDLELPREVTLINLINDSTFRDIVGDDMWQRMDLIRRMGNIAAPGKKSPRSRRSFALKTCSGFWTDLRICMQSRESMLRWISTAAC